MKGKVRRKRVLALLLSAVIFLSAAGTSASAQEDLSLSGEYGAGEAHVHTEACYTWETDCVHVHTADCRSEIRTDSLSANEVSMSGNSVLPAEGEEREPDACPHVCSEESGCVVRKLNCSYETGKVRSAVVLP